MKQLAALLTLTIALLIAPVVRAQQQPVLQIHTLSLADATKLAEQYHPSLRAAQAGQQQASAGLTVAESNYYPQLTATATAARTDGAFVFNPDFPPRNQTYNTYTTGLQFNQTVFDFGRTINRVSANSSFVNAANHDYDAALETVVQNVQIAYYSLVQATDVVTVDSQAVLSAEGHLKQAQAFYSVGRAAKFDVTNAQVNLANANVAMIAARNQIAIARLGLEDAMGIHPSTPFTVTDSLEIRPFDMPLDSIQTITIRHRPDLLSASERVEANRSLASAAWDQNMPTIGISGTWNWSAFNLPLYPRLNAGVTVSLPLFQGFAISAQADQAQAAAEQSQANYDLLLQSVQNEAEQNYLSLKNADERLRATEALVQQATENLQLAERQYAAGVSAFINVTDAQLSLSNARITRIQAMFDYNSALTRLRRSMGTLTK